MIGIWNLGLWFGLDSTKDGVFLVFVTQYIFYYVA